MNSDLPLLEAQEGLWHAQRLDPGNPIHNTAQYVELRGPLDVAVFADAVDKAHGEADALAVAIADGADGPCQRLTEELRARLRVVDLTAEPDPATVALAHMHRDMRRPLDPAVDPLAAEVLFVLGPDHHLWYQRAHHLVIDGYGKVLLSRRIADLYSAAVTQAAPVTAPFAPFPGVLAEDAAYRTSPRRAADAAYWREAFAEMPEVRGLASGVAVSAHGCHRIGLDVAPELCRELAALAARAGQSWPDVATGMIGAYIVRHTGGDEVVAGVPAMGRLGSAAARVPCMVMNVLPVPLAIDEDSAIAGWLADVAGRLRQARRHGRYRSEQLRRDLSLLGANRRLHGPIINVLPLDERLDLAGLSAEVHILGTGAVDDITFTLRGDLGQHALRLEIEANPELYGLDDVTAHLARLAAFLDAASRAERLADVPTLTASEHHRWTEEVNDTAHPVPGTTLTALIEATVARSPDATALVFGAEELSYAELAARTEKLAAVLTAHGVRRGDVVGVALPRSLELVVALLATLRCGAAYLPIDPDHPRDRVAAMLSTALPRVVLAETGKADLIPDDVVVLPADGGPLPAGGVAVAPEPPRPQDAAYVLYTSGSTGLPKGVVIEHRAIVNRLEWMRLHYGIGADERILQKTPATFDVSVWEFFLPLIAGATLVIAPPEAHKDPAWLAALMRDGRITTLHFVPSMLAAFLAEPSAAGLSMRRVFCSGEALPAETRVRFHGLIEAELHNLYGPTEAAVDVTFWPASRQDTSAQVPIGFPVWNTRMYVLDGRLRPLPPGVAGELYIAGVQLAREYLRQPELTAERFVADPFVAGARMYRTGDLARWRRDGALDFLGRTDHQVKIRGQRVELGEIESAILSSGLVDQAVVLAQDGGLLVAYVTPVTVDVDAARADAARRLPGYMLPSVIMPLDRLPVTRNGKLDRAALPAARIGSDAPAGRMPVSDTERRVAALFADVLGLAPESIGAEDDFFRIGGHSLLAAKLMTRVRAEWRQDVGFGALFAHSTVAEFAAVLDGLGMGDDLAKVIRLREGPARGPLFCIHPAGGISWSYRGLAHALVHPRAVYGLQAAGLDVDADLPASLDAMAEDYAATVMALRPEGPVHLAGWSVGGILAQTVAARLMALGRRVGVVALLDAYPADVWRDQPDPGPNAGLKAMLQIAGHDPAAHDEAGLSRSVVMDILRRENHPLGALSDRALAGVMRVVESNNHLVRGHRQPRYNECILHFMAALDHAGRGLGPRLWTPYAADVKAFDVPALHAHLPGAEAVAHIAPLLDAELMDADGREDGK